MREEGDAEELREILDTVSKFLRELKDLVKDILDAIMSSYDGARLGKELGEFYKSLVEAGVPEEQALELMKQFYDKKMGALPSLGDVFSTIKEFIKREVFEGEESKTVSKERTEKDG